jgi:hypothetical protein
MFFPCTFIGIMMPVKETVIGEEELSSPVPELP